MSQNQEVSLSGLVRRQWRVMIAVVFASLGAAGLFSLLTPKRYESHMKFLVNNERADLVITPEKNQAAAVQTEVSEAQVNSEIELIKSRDILQGVVSDQHLYPGTGTKQSEERGAAYQMSLARGTLSLQQTLHVAALRKTNIIDVAYRGAKPEQVVSVLKDLGDRYLSAHLAAHSAPGSYRFFADQVAKYADQLVRSRADLSAFHRDKLLFSLPEQQTATIASLEEMKNQLRGVTASIQEQEAKLVEAKKQMTVLPERVSTQVRQIPNQGAAEKLHTMLAEMRTRRVNLAMKFKAGDRLLTELDQQIAVTQGQLSEIESNRAVEQTSDLDALHQSFKADVANGEVTLIALRAKQAGLMIQRDSVVGELERMDANAATLQDLEQHEKEATENYTLYSRRMEEVRVADSLDAQKVSNVSMIEKPVYSPIPVSPKPSFNLAGGFVAGLFLAFAVAYLVDSMQGRGEAQGYKIAAHEMFDGQIFPARVSGD